jgi:hypothetical protein
MIDDVTAKTSEVADSDAVMSSYLAHSFIESGPEPAQFGRFSTLASDFILHRPNGSSAQPRTSTVDSRWMGAIIPSIPFPCNHWAN